MAAKLKICKQVFNLFLLFVVFLLSFYFVEWTVDRYNYETMLTNIDVYDTDFIFKIIAILSVKYSYSYDQVYHFHIIIEAFLFALFSNKITNKPFIPLLFFILLNFVNIANQLRFFVGLGIFFYSMTLYDKNKIVYYLLGVLACMNHLTMVIMFLIMPFRNIICKIKFRNYLVISFVIVLVVPFIKLLLPSFLMDFVRYLDDKYKSSILGGIFNLLPTIFFVFTIMKTHSYLLIRYEILKDCNYKLLYSLSVFSFVFIPLSVFFQLFSQRFVFTFILIWVAYLFNYYPKSNKKLKVCMMGIFTILWFYLSPLIFLGYSYYWDNLLVMFGFKEYLNV